MVRHISAHHQTDRGGLMCPTIAYVLGIFIHPHPYARYYVDCLHSSQRTADLPPTSLCQILWIAYIHPKGQWTSHPHPYPIYSMDCLHSSQRTAASHLHPYARYCEDCLHSCQRTAKPPTDIPMPDTPWIAYIQAKGPQTSHPHP